MKLYENYFALLIEDTKCYPVNPVYFSTKIIIDVCYVDFGLCTFNADLRSEEEEWIYYVPSSFVIQCLAVTQRYNQVNWAIEMPRKNHKNLMRIFQITSANNNLFKQMPSLRPIHSTLF